MALDIIIVTYNAKDKLRRCLDSIKRYTQGIKYKITVVDNKCNDGTVEFLRKYCNDKVDVVLNKHNLGFSGGANIGLKNTKGKFIVLIDDDAEVTRGWAKLVYLIKGRPKVGIVGCKISYPNTRIFAADYRIRQGFLAGKDEVDKGQRDYIKECDAIVGTFWGMRRELLGKVGYFDERFYPSQHEDIDYCIRTRLAGFKIIYNGKIKIIHHHLFRDGGNNMVNLNKFYKKWNKDMVLKFPLKDSDSLDKHIAQGVKYFRRNNFSKALSEFKQAELSHGYSSEFFYKGLALKGMGMFDEAEKEFKRVISMSPRFPPAYSNLVLIYRKTGRIKESRDMLSRLVKFIE